MGILIPDDAGKPVPAFDPRRVNGNDVRVVEAFKNALATHNARNFRRVMVTWLPIMLGWAAIAFTIWAVWKPPEPWAGIIAMGGGFCIFMMMMRRARALFGPIMAEELLRMGRCGSCAGRIDGSLSERGMTNCAACGASWRTDRTSAEIAGTSNPSSAARTAAATARPTDVLSDLDGRLLHAADATLPDAEAWLGEGAAPLRRRLRPGLASTLRRKAPLLLLGVAMVAGLTWVFMPTPSAAATGPRPSTILVALFGLPPALIVTLLFLYLLNRFARRLDWRSRVLLAASACPSCARRLEPADAATFAPCANCGGRWPRR